MLHATQHANINDAMEAVQARVGVTGSAVTSSLTYRLAQLETYAITTGSWTSWVPVLAQNGSVVTKTDTYCRYSKHGRTITVMAHIAVTAAGTAGTDIAMTLPFNAASYTASRCIGTFHYFDSGTTVYAGSAMLTGASEVKFQSGGANTGFLGTTPSLALASADQITFTVTYETTS